MKILTFSSLLAVLLLGASQADASSVSFSSTSGSFAYTGSVSVSKFDSSLGTLTGVLVEGSFSGGSTLVFSDLGPEDIELVSATIRQGFRFRDPSLNQAIAYVDSNVISGQTLTSGNSLSINSGTVSGSDSFSLGASQASGYVGSGFVNFALANSFGASPQTILYGLATYNTALTGSAVGTVKVTYTYTPIAPVPEPSSWLLGLGSLAGLGGLGMIRQRKAA